MLTCRARRRCRIGFVRRSRTRREHTTGERRSDFKFANDVRDPAVKRLHERVSDLERACWPRRPRQGSDVLPSEATSSNASSGISTARLFGTCVLTCDEASMSSRTKHPEAVHTTNSRRLSLQIRQSDLFTALQRKGSANVCRGFK